MPSVSHATDYFPFQLLYLKEAFSSIGADCRDAPAPGSDALRLRHGAGAQVCLHLADQKNDRG